MLLPMTLSNFVKLGIPQANVYYMRRRGASAGRIATNSLWLAPGLRGGLAPGRWLGGGPHPDRDHRRRDALARVARAPDGALRSGARPRAHGRHARLRGQVVPPDARLDAALPHRPVHDRLLPEPRTGRALRHRGEPDEPAP